MPHPTTTILYVTDPLASARWWGELLGLRPVETSPGFALFVLSSGLQLGLWKAADVRPQAMAPGGSELTITLGRAEDLDALHADWVRGGHAVLQAPEDMDFGRTATIADPDGHRLRAFAPHSG